MFNSLRKELQQMGLGGGLGNWRQLTSGGHAVLLFSKVQALPGKASRRPVPSRRQDPFAKPSRSVPLGP